MKTYYIVEMSNATTRKIIYEIRNIDNWLCASLVKVDGLEKQRLPIGTLVKTTKRGWTIKSYWLTSNATRIFLPRGNFEIRNELPKDI